MKKLFFIFIFAFVFCTFSFAQTNDDSACPKIETTEPKGTSMPDDHIRFSANVTGYDNLKYEWSVTNGEILLGKYSSIIIVEPDKSENGIGIEAKVKIEGLPENCPNTATATAVIPVVCLDWIIIEQYETISFDEEKKRLVNAATALKNNPNTSISFTLHYSEETGSEKMQKRMKKIEEFLTKEQKIPRERFVFAPIEDGYDGTSIFLIPPRN